MALSRCDLRSLAPVATLLVWALTAAANEPDATPPVLDADGRLSNAFIEEVRRQDDAKYRQQYTVNFTERVLDYAVGWEADEEPPRVTEQLGSVKADLATGDHEVTKTAVHRVPPRHYVGSRTSGAGYQPQACDPYRWAYRVDDRRGLAGLLESARDDVVWVREEAAESGSLVRICTQARDRQGRPTPAGCRELVLNLSRGYRPQQIVEQDTAGTRTETDITLERNAEAGIWIASGVHQRVYDLRTDDEELRREVTYAFSEFTARTHIRFRD